MEHFTLGYGNSKLGKGIPVVTAPRSTCPSSCPLRNKACYAENPGPFRWHWNFVSDGRRGVSFDELIKKINTIQKGSMWRWGQAGDLPGKKNKISTTGMYAIIRANHLKMGYAYTHKNVLGNTGVAQKNRDLIAYANEKGFVVALSADNMSDADEKVALKIGPVVLSVQSFDNLPRKTPSGHQLVPCPEQTSNGKIKCAQCQLCAKPRKSIVVFENTSRRIKFKNNLLGENK